MYIVRYSPDALAALDDPQAIPRRIATAVLRRVDDIALDPFATRPNVERLKAMKNAFRLRLGDWRVVYTVDPTARVLLVAAVKHRKEVYR
jgi:mRNA interferase RelE/StbE